MYIGNLPQSIEYYFMNIKTTIKCNIIYNKHYSREYMLRVKNKKEAA